MSESSLSLLSFFQDRYCLKPKMAAGSKRSKAVYLNDVNRVREYFHARVEQREVLLTDLSATLIEAAMSWQIERGREKATANKLRRHMLAIWRYAGKCGLVPKPAESVEEIKEPHREPECWWMSEWERILESGSRLEGRIGDIPAAVFADALLRTVYNTGARITSVMSIESDWVDLKGGSLLIKAEVQKDGEDQRVTLLPLTVVALEKLGAHGRLKRLFDDWPYDRKVDQWPALNRWFKKILVDADLFTSTDDVTRRDLWHKVRRTFATYITAKAGIAVAQSMLGHSSIEVTKRYVDRSKLDVPSVADLLVDPNPSRLRVFDPGKDATG